jgi:hypothetical protein
MQTNGQLDEEYVLGHFEANNRTDSEEKHSATADAGQVDGASSLKTLTGRPVYLQDTYTNGEYCNMAGKPRHTQVRFVCQEKLPNMAILSYAETSTCEYLVVVSVPSLCQHHAFSDKVWSSPPCLSLAHNKGPER